MPLGNSIKEEISIAEAYLATRRPLSATRSCLITPSCSTAASAGTPATAARHQDGGAAHAKAGKTLPIMDTHIHEFQPSRPGVVWRTPAT